jgi:hypothetical protein
VAPYKYRITEEDIYTKRGQQAFNIIYLVDGFAALFCSLRCVFVEQKLHYIEDTPNIGDGRKFLPGVGLFLFIYSLLWKSRNTVDPYFQELKNRHNFTHAWWKVFKIYIQYTYKTYKLISQHILWGPAYQKAA